MVKMTSKKAKSGIQKYVVIIGLFFCCIGIMNIIRGVQYSKNDKASSADYVTISAEITDIVSERVGDSDEYEYKYDVYVTYTYDGTVYENKKLNMYSSSMYVGKTIDILCNSKHPATIKGISEFGSAGGVLIGMGVMFVIVGLMVAIVFSLAGGKNAKDRQRKANRIPGEVSWKRKGLRLAGEVENIVLEPQYSVNGREPYIIICTYLDVNSNTIYRFKSDFFVEDPSNVVYQGMPIDIYVNPEDYSQYYVDIEQLQAQKMVDFS